MVDPAERELRKQFEQHVGRPLTDDEWETAKRIMVQSAGASSSTRSAGWVWTGTDKAAWAGALVAVVGGVSLAVGWDFVFSPLVRVPLGLFVWLIVLVYAGVWLKGLFSGGGGVWGWLGWAWWGLFWGVFLVIPFAIAGSLLIFKDREYLTADREWFTGDSYPPAQVVGWGLVFVSILLAVAGRPVRSGSG